MQAWTNVTGISFNTVTSGADIFFYDDQSGAYSSSTVSSGTIISSIVNVSTDWLSSSGTTLDSYSFQTYIHEVGHALGLGHAGNYNGSANYGTDNHYLNDSWQGTIMPYMSQNNNTAVDASFAYIVTPMIADIIAILDLYGSNTNKRTGNTTYGENSTAGGYYDQIAGLSATVAFTILDDGGVDTIDFGSQTADQIVNLAAEGISDIGGHVGNMIIARGTVIENFVSGSGNDTINGNSAVNNLSAGGGNDILNGGLGADVLDGGTGNDTATYEDAAAAVGAYLNWGVSRGADGRDSYVSIENLTGSTYDDWLFGDAGVNTIHGGDGHDIIKSKGGADFLYGDDGNDRIVGDTEDDHLWGGKGDDIVVGARGDDTMYGDEGADRIYGYLGHDTIYGGDGDDRLFSHNGNDFIDGGKGSDLIVGGDHNDTLFGGDDKDYLYGDDGIDSINGGKGDDILYGGALADTFIFETLSGYDKIKGWEDGIDKIDLSAWGFSGLSDVLAISQDYAASVRLNFADGSMLLIGGVTSSSFDSGDFIFT